MLRVTLKLNTDHAREAVKKAKAKLYAMASDRYQQKLRQIFSDVVTVSPQYSGDYASNWRVNLVGVASYSQWPNKHSISNRHHPHAAGDAEAVSYAESRAKATLDVVHWSQKVHIVNATPLIFTASTVTGPDGKQQAIRPENLIAGGVLLKSYLKDKYGS